MKIKISFHLLYEAIEEVGVENIVHVITNNAFNYVAIENLLEEKYPTI